MQTCMDNYAVGQRIGIIIVNLTVVCSHRTRRTRSRAVDKLRVSRRRHATRLLESISLGASNVPT